MSYASRTRVAFLLAAVATICACSDDGSGAEALEAPAIGEQSSNDFSVPLSNLVTSDRSEAAQRRALEPDEDTAFEALRARRFMDPFEVQLSGALISESAGWRLVVAEAGGRDLSRMLMIGKGRGTHGRLSSSLAAEDALARSRQLLVLGTDGSFFGEASAGPDLLVSRSLNVEVVATAALEVVMQQASGASGEGDYLFELERKSLRHRITTRMSPDGRTLFEERLECGKWLPFGEYRVSLESPVFEALPVDISLSAGSPRQVSLQCFPRRDLVELVVEIRSTSGDEYTDFPVLEISDGPGRELIEAPDIPGVLACGPRLYHYRQLPDRVDGTWGFRLQDRQPETLSITTDQAGTLTEHRDPVRDGVLRVVLDWTPEADEPEPR